jgi:pimeloyl-ACP methyl ester carboxylesterase
MERLAGRFRVIAGDLYGHGNSPPWPHGNTIYLEDEVEFLEPVFRAAGESFHLIGHSFGGAVALKAALKYPGRVRSLVLFEPVLFSLLVASASDGPAAREILAHRDETLRLAETGRGEEAAAVAVDYWFGASAWAAMPEATRSDILARMGNVKLGWHQVFCEPMSLSEIASINAPTLYLTAAKSNGPMRALNRLLIDVLPRVRAVEMKNVGHMAPVTHPGKVNRLIEDFLDEVA